eukprot:s170_g5.t1
MLLLSARWLVPISVRHSHRFFHKPGWSSQELRTLVYVLPAVSLNKPSRCDGKLEADVRPETQWRFDRRVFFFGLAEQPGKLLSHASFNHRIALPIFFCSRSVEVTNS